MANDPHLLPGQPEAALRSLARPGDMENSGQGLGFGTAMQVQINDFRRGLGPCRLRGHVLGCDVIPADKDAGVGAGYEL